MMPEERIVVAIHSKWAGEGVWEGGRYMSNRHMIVKDLTPSSDRRACLSPAVPKRGRMP